MDNLDFGNIAIGAVIVAVFNLAIVVLTKTETILKVVERIKRVVRLDYKGRAKRSTDEVRLFKRHAEVARERVRHSFVTMELWRCKWTWNWSENLEPINIKGFCLGDDLFECNHPVYPYYVPVDGALRHTEARTIGVTCSNPVTRLQTKGVADRIHNRTRHVFEVIREPASNSDNTFNTIISRSILSERDLRIANEIKKLRLQFWR
jgi:hypothetical protein